ncbi:MAG: primosomal protein N' [Deltaproteobacteria bacterium]|nr:MAG: primosomal protein N' [Deltaproteobacteria bacterium]
MDVAEVAVELPVAGTYHYEVPARWSMRPLVGARVLVPFGGRGVTGIVVAYPAAAAVPAGQMRPIEDVLDDVPPVSAELLDLCLWVARYYEAPPGEVLRAALPAGTRVTAARFVALTDAGREALAGAAGGALPRRLRDVLGRVAGAGGAIAARQLGARGIRREDVDALVASGLLQRTTARSRARVRPRTERVAVAVGPVDAAVRAALARAPKRLAVLEAIVAAGGAAAVADLKHAEPRAADHVRALSRAGLVEVVHRPVRRDGWAVAADDVATSAPVEPPQLTEPQRAALDQIARAVDDGVFRSFVLHGVTGSGKTEVYLHAIARALAAGKSAIVLVPEISLTPQLAARFRARFGDRVAVLHSGLSDGERFDEWHRLRRGQAAIALGARSAVFAPVDRLGVVVVDEEHDSSFKQEEGVRYHARDVALVRAQRAGAVCILGSATPSLESYRAAATGRHALLELPSRATARPLPEVDIVDLRTYQPEGDAMLTAPLAAAIDDALAAGDQVILFLNRRGFSTFVVCGRCGHAFRCPHCSVALTHHHRSRKLLCHYCGHSEPVPDRCTPCGGAKTILRRGIGTEKVAAAVGARYPGARVARLDRDSAAGAGLHDVLRRVARREVDILVGTQMVTKGHDFPGVTLVGVLCADTGLSLPDFRASERTFQLLTQVAGRAGRGDRPGRVVIQTYRPEAVAVAAAGRHDYAWFYRAESASRAELGYPPFGHVIAVRFDGPDPGAVRAVARQFEDRIRALRAPGVTALGPVEAPLARLKGRSRWHVWLRGSDRKAVRAAARALVAPGVDRPASVRVVVDVDPVSAL